MGKVYILVNPQTFFIKYFLISFEVISSDRLLPARRMTKLFIFMLLKCLADVPGQKNITYGFVLQHHVDGHWK